MTLNQPIKLTGDGETGPKLHEIICIVHNANIDSLTIHIIYTINCLRYACVLYKNINLYENVYIFQLYAKKKNA